MPNSLMYVFKQPFVVFRMQFIIIELLFELTVIFFRGLIPTFQRFIWLGISSDIRSEMLFYGDALASVKITSTWSAILSSVIK